MSKKELLEKIEKRVVNKKKMKWQCLAMLILHLSISIYIGHLKIQLLLERVSEEFDPVHLLVNDVWTMMLAIALVSAFIWMWNLVESLRPSFETEAIIALLKEKNNVEKVDISYLGNRRHCLQNGSPDCSGS
jgi:hypothetical protein